jgi:hypothetical protein
MAPDAGPKMIFMEIDMVSDLVRSSRLGLSWVDGS